jgi:hypothetical protein
MVRLVVRGLVIRRGEHALRSVGFVVFDLTTNPQESVMVCRHAWCNKTPRIPANTSHLLSVCVYQKCGGSVPLLEAKVEFLMRVSPPTYTVPVAACRGPHKARLVLRRTRTLSPQAVP